MSKFMTPKTTNEEFIHYEVLGEEFNAPAEVEYDLPTEAIILDRYFNQWFACLSADGYTDATEWFGPHETEDQALYDLFVFYGQENETFFDFIGEGKLILEGSLHTVGHRNELYGKAVEDGSDIWLATLGDAGIIDPDQFYIMELAEAYGFELLSPAKAKVFQERYNKASTI